MAFSSNAAVRQATNNSVQLIQECRNDSCTKTGKMLRCGGCRTVSYCGPVCQKAHWLTHKPYCDKRLVAPPKLTGRIQLPLKTAERVEQLTQERFKQMTGVYYSSKAVCLKEIAFPPSKVQSELWATRPPRLVVEEDSFGLTLIADENIPKGTVIAPLGGKIVDPQASKDWQKTYRTSLSPNYDLDQNDYGGVGRVVRDGPPNACLDQGPNGQVLIIAAAPIEKRKPIYLDYGAEHPVKSGRYHISEEAYQQFTLWSKTPTMSHTGSLAYLYGTVPVLTRFLLEGRLNLKQVGAVCALALQPSRTSRAQVLRPARNPQEFIEGLEARDMIETHFKNFPFLYAYPVLLLVVEKLKDKPELKQKMIELSRILTVRTYIAMLPIISFEIDVTSAWLDQWGIAGQLLDQVYLFAHGTLRGSYLDKSDPFPDVQIDLAQWKSRYERLAAQSIRTFVQLALKMSTSALETPSQPKLENLLEWIRGR